MKHSKTFTTILFLLLINSVILVLFASESYSKPPTGACNLIFTSVTTWDNEVEWDSGSVEASIHNNNRDILYLSISNGYPGYVAFIMFELKNIGGRPAKIEGYSISTPRPEYYEIEVTYLDDKIDVAPGETITGLMKVKLQDMLGQGAANHFRVKIWASSH